MKPRFLLPLTIALAVSPAAAPVSSAASVSWDGGVADIAGDGDSVSAGGSGTWNLTIKNWDAGVSPHVAWVDADDAVFAGSGGTVTLGANISAGNLSLSEGNYDFTADVFETTLTLTGGITSTGPFHRFFSANSFGLALSGNQAFDILGGVRVSTTVSGSGTITKTGSGMISFGGNASAFTGRIVVQEGRFGVTSGTSLNTNPGALAADSITLDGGALVCGHVSSAASAFDNGNTVDLHANRGITLGDYGGTIMVGYGSDGRINVRGIVSGTGGLTKTDSGILALYGAGTYEGGTTISGGVVSVGSLTTGSTTSTGDDTGLGTGSVTVDSGGQLVIAGINRTLANDITLRGAATIHDRQGALVGGYQDGGSANKLTGTLFLEGIGDRTLSTWWNDKTFELAGQVTGTGNLRVVNIKADASNEGGIIILSDSSNDYSGDTIISAGKNPTLRLGADNVIPNGEGMGNVIVDGRLQVNGRTDTINGLSGGGTVNLDENGVLIAGDNDATTTFSGNLNGASTARLRKIGAGMLTLSGAGDNSSAQAVLESGTLVFAKDSNGGVHAVGSGGGESYALEITDGTAILGGTGDDQIYASSAVHLSGGTFDLAGRSEGFDGLSGTGGLITNSVSESFSTLTLGENNSQGSPAFAGVIEDGSGTVSLIKTGEGVQTLAGENTHTGGTTVNSGTLELAETGGLKFVIGANGVNNKVTGSGAAVIHGSFILDLTGADMTDGNSWTLVDTASTTFESTFTIHGFTKSGTIHTKEDDENIVFNELTGKLAVGSSGGYSSWITGFGLAVEDQDPTDDPDGDGINNLMEYALGGDPNSSDPTIAPAGSKSGDDFILTFTRNDAALTGGDVAIIVEYGDDLTVWDSAAVPATDGTVDGVSFSITGGSPNATVTATIPTSGAPKFFARVKAVR